MSDLLELMKHDFRIYRVAKGDASKRTDRYKDLRELVAKHGQMYPGIEAWFDRRVQAGLRTGERVSFIGYFDEKPAVSAIVKRSGDSKICHIKVEQNLQGMHLGEIFIILMALEVRDFSNSMHITMPESLWRDKSGFFSGFGYQQAVVNPTQYRHGDVEVRTEVTYDRIWRMALNKLPKLCEVFSIGGLTLGDGLVMSIQPKFAEAIMSGQKRIEIRRKFDRKWAGRSVKIYSSSPVQAVVGEALIEEVEFGHPQLIWSKYAHTLGCSKSEYDDYVSGTSEVAALHLGGVRRYVGDISLSQLMHLTNRTLKPPQSYYILRNNSDWAEAVSVAALLQSKFVTSKPLCMSL